ncbi:MAG: sulfite exporter TauE/SafE family protein [Myxococcales bacterium]|nr:sulfite exporter TauE/SafE family protein [Myxococcales bacterium]
MTPASLGAVLIASLIGSLHCVGMCGGFVAVVGGAGGMDATAPSPLRRATALLAYQGTRGLAYAGLGGAAGLLGAGLDHSAALLGLQRLAGPLMGLTLIAMALASLAPRLLGTNPGTSKSAGLVSLQGHRPPRPAAGLRRRLADARLRLTLAMRRRSVAAGAAAGLLSALLPCGWLWAYVLLAASTGSAGSGALVMVAFWLGGVPALLGAGLLAGAVGRRLGAHAPTITAAVLVALGVMSLAGKLTPPVEPADHDDADAQIVETSTAPDAVLVPPREAPCH